MGLKTSPVQERLDSQEIDFPLVTLVKLCLWAIKYIFRKEIIYYGSKNAI